MCANYVPPTPKDLERLFNTQPIDFAYPPEAWPRREAPLIRPAVDGAIRVERQLQCFPARFGLVPSWSETPAVKQSTHNAREETIAKLGSYRSAWKATRFCLVPMQAFFEPRYQTDDNKSVRWKVFRRDGEPFAAAAIFDEWTDRQSGEVLTTFSMITVNADSHPLMRNFHKPREEKRSIVLLPTNIYDEWLSLKNPETARAFLKLFDADEYDAEAAPLPRVTRGAVPPEQATNPTDLFE